MKRKLIFTLIGSTFLVLCASATTLGQCKNNLGRANERFCVGQPAFDECVSQLKAGTYEVCILEGRPEARVHRATPEAAQADLIKRGCKQLPDNTFVCNEKADMWYCTGYQNYFQMSSDFPTPGQVMPPKPVAGCKFEPPTQDFRFGEFVYLRTDYQIPITSQKQSIKRDATIVLPDTELAKCKSNECGVDFGMVAIRSKWDEALISHIRIENFIDGKSVGENTGQVSFNAGQATTDFSLLMSVRPGATNNLTILFDPDAKTAETNESNNVFKVTIVVPPKP